MAHFLPHILICPPLVNLASCLQSRQATGPLSQAQTRQYVCFVFSGTNPEDVSITVVAGLLDLAAGVHLDFDPEQIDSFHAGPFAAEKQPVWHSA